MPSIRTTLRRAYNATIGLVVAPQLWIERTRRLPFISERLVEYSTALRWIAERYPKRLLDVGPGEGVWPRLLDAEGIEVVALDEVRGYWGSRFANRHFKVTPGDITRAGVVTPASFDCVTCISTLEHIPDHRAAMQNMLDALVPGGELIVTVPYNERHSHPNVYALPTASYGTTSYIAQQFSRHEVDEWTGRPDVELLELERWCVFTGDHWTEGDRAPVPKRVGADEKHQLACLRFRRL